MVRLGLVPWAVVFMGCGGAAHTKYLRADGLEVHTFTRESSNAHLLMKNGVGVLVDSGYEAAADGLLSDLKAAGIAPTAIKAVIVTHGHADHAGGARVLHERLQVPVIGGTADVGMFSSGKNEPLCPTGLIGRLRHSKDEAATYTPYQLDVALTEQVDLATLVPGLDGKVLLLPGHTRGSLVVVTGDVAVVGDLFRGSVIGSSAATHLFMCDEEGNRHDIVRMLDALAPAATLYLVGHFGPVSREAVATQFR